MDVPMPTHKLDGELTLVFYGDAIGEYIVILAGTGIRGLIFRLYTYLYTFSYLRNHLIKNIIFFYFTTGIKCLFVEIFVMTKEVKIGPTWKGRLTEEFEKPYFRELTNFVKEEFLAHTVYPPGKEIFRAFDCCDFNTVKVVIIGQDPYHGPGQANGLCFSVRDGIRMPPSLVNIFKEIQKDLGKPIPPSGDLERWAKQGVLLLNATLTVRAASAGSHQNKGWETFTDAVIKKISDEKENIVFMLWGAYAQKKGEIIDRSKHYVLMSAHPSPFSADRGFFGGKHFSKTNEYLKSKGLKEIEW